MTRTDQLAWALAHLTISGDANALLSNGSTVTLQPTFRIRSNPRHYWRVLNKHGPMAGRLVLVETTPDGQTRNHWRHTVQA